MEIARYLIIALHSVLFISIVYMFVETTKKYSIEYIDRESFTVILYFVFLCMSCYYWYTKLWI